MDTVKFKAHPPMSSSAENQNKNKLCEFHGDKGHNTNDYIHLKKQIEEAMKCEQLSHLIKELKKGNTKGDHPKATKKVKLLEKETSSHIYGTTVAANNKEKNLSEFLPKPKNLMSPIGK
ncbi:hypothetical protein Tco_1296242 [Tanacetum coccineum]